MTSTRNNELTDFELGIELRENSQSPNGSRQNLTKTEAMKESIHIQDTIDENNIAPPQVDSIESSVGNPTSTNPQEWPKSKKWRAVSVAAAYTFLSPISSSMVAPALPIMASDLKMTETIEVEMAMSIFVLAFAFGPLILAPLSEVYGRFKIMQFSVWVFILFNLACGFAKTTAQILIFRFLAGLGGSAPIAVAGSIISDLFNQAEMGKAMASYGLGVILAPAIGPIIGGILTQNTTWHWAFYVVSIVTAVVAIIGTFAMPETYRPYLEAQARKSAALKYTSVIEHPLKSKASNTIKVAVVRPFILLGTQPITQVIGLYMAFIYGLLYIVLTTYSALFVFHYGESTQTSTFHYLALGLGSLIGTLLAGVSIDFSSRYLQKRYNTPHKAEYRLVVAIPASITLPVGLFVYGWAADKNWHWVVVDLGIVIFSCSVNIIFQALTVYTVDVYTLYSASALAAVGFLRSVFGFGFPLFATNMYDELGYGWANSTLAFIGLGIGIPASILLYVSGEKIRNKSKFATG
ncbi:hypothetical protein HK100_007598 [Physocladia obscura]|uniref:Major facilitator superfamily (MFS) profile domain-containing protein n=1 Tax=Physocladia obscura TaxID=109957 RepID=A0AAD5X866_9FUNG|nr:hypothetical protein HK100_007598 [Physocladia obscura]